MADEAGVAEMTVERVQAMVDASPFCRFLGVKVTEIDPEAGRVTCEMRHRPEFARKPGDPMLHGGVLSAFADTVGDFALAVMVGGAVPTIDLRIDYLRPATTERIVGVGIVRKKGRTLGVVDVEIHDDDGRVVSIARGTYSAVVG